MKTNNDNTIDLITAEIMCSNWRAAFSSAFPTVPPMQVLRGFRIPIADINALAEEHGAIAVRIYMAMENPADASSLKMLLVPVILNSQGQEVDKIMDVEPIAPPQYYIYDFTQPCPIQCDYNSPLFGSFDEEMEITEIDIIIE